MTYFNNSIIAEGYQNKRPHFHPIVINKIKTFINLKQKLNNALDVGCGTGLSTIALKELSENVVGTDSSKEMIDLTKKEDHIKYFNYAAEELPFEKESFDLITLSGSIQWIVRDAFFKIARKIIKESGYLVIYDNYFFGQIKDNDHFGNWYINVFLKHFPRPPRNESPITDTESKKYGFDFVKDEKYTNEVEYSLPEFVDYLTTLTNITITLDKNPDKLPEIKKWLTEELVGYFQNEKEVFIFGGYIWYFHPSHILFNN